MIILVFIHIYYFITYVIKKYQVLNNGTRIRDTTFNYIFIFSLNETQGSIIVDSEKQMSREIIKINNDGNIIIQLKKSILLNSNKFEFHNF